MDDVLKVVAGPGDVLLSGLERRADGVHARSDAMEVLVDFGEDRRADTRHDSHVDDHICGVGEFDADLRDGRADGPHGEGKDVGVFPVVGGAGVVPGEGADEGALLDARDVGGH